LNHQWKDSLWDRFYMGAPGRQRQSVERYHPVLQRGRRRQESLIALSKRYGINPKTVAKWKKRTAVKDLPTGPKDAHSTVLSIEDEAVIVAFRKHTLLPLDDCLYALQATIPHLTRSSLHRCLQRSQMFADCVNLPAWDQSAARSDRRQGTEEEVQDIPHRLLPHRHRRSADRRRQATAVRGDRPDKQVRLRRVAPGSREGDRRPVLAQPDRCCALCHPHRAD
jgi:hypothetical protein